MEVFKLTATIPTVQYGNIQPELSAEAETFEEAQQIVLARMEDLWKIYGERPLTKNAKSEDGVEVITFTGEKVLWYEDRHEYTDLEGNHLVSGSEYAKSSEKPFDTAMLAGKVGKKYGIDPALVAEAWKQNSKVSTTFGTSLHLAMEQWFRFSEAACEDKQYNLAKPAYLRAAVESFPLRAAQIIPEAVVSNIANKMAGTIDGIHITGEKTCEILDYKSDTDVEKNLPKHFRQLSYYAKILQLAGWSVSGVCVWNYTDKWTPFTSEVLEIK